jgi:hypothetical protein
MTRNPILVALTFSAIAFAGSAFACEDKESAASVKEPVLAPTPLAATKRPATTASDKTKNDAALTTDVAKKPAVAKKSVVVAGSAQ